MSMLPQRLVLWDDAVYNAMLSFPLHKFDTPLVAVVPMRSATREHFVAVFEAEGRISCVSPTIHAIHSVTTLLEEDAQEEAILSGISVYESELCVVLWQATLQSYTAHFLKAQRTALTQIGSAVLSPPDPSIFLCGVTHLGHAICVVWSNSVVQYYTPSTEAQSGLALAQTYRLSGFDFWAMKKGAGTEDLRKLPGGVSVCSSLNVPGLVCIVGPQAECYRLKFVVLNCEAGFVQESGMVETPNSVAAPVKMIPDRIRSGEFRLFVGEENCGVKTIHMTPTTLATRIGIKAPNRKRKLTEETTLCQMETAHEHRKTLHAPDWAQLLSSFESKGGRTGRFTRKALKKFSPSEAMRNGEIAADDSFDDRVSKCVASLQEPHKSQKDLVKNALAILKEGKSREEVLLVDLTGMTAEAIGRNEGNWHSLTELLSLSPPRSLTFCPELPEKLLKAGQYELFLQLLAGIQESSSEELSALLQSVFVQNRDSTALASQMNAMDRMQSTIAASFSALEESPPDVSVEQYEHLKWRVHSFSGFSFDELLLHGVVALPLSRADLEPVLQNLTRAQLKFFITYLHKWLQILKSEIPVPDRIDRLELIQRIPSLQNVMDWISIVLLLHAHSIINDPSLHPVHPSLIEACLMGVILE